MINRLFPFILILASIGVFYFYINPTYTQGISAVQQQIHNYDNALKASKEYAARQNDLISQKNQISSQNLDRLQTFLPDDVDNVQLILDLSNLASRTNVALSGFSISQPSDSNANTQQTTSNASAAPTGSGTSQGLSSAVGSSNLTDSLDVTVNVTGTYSDFRNFLQQTEESLRLLDVTTISVSPSTQGAYNFGMTFRLYWLH